MRPAGCHRLNGARAVSNYFTISQPLPARCPHLACFVGFVAVFLGCGGKTRKKRKEPETVIVPGSSSGAGNGIRTRDPNLGKVVLYQLSYSRVGSRR
jgi:hypothetical protein